MKNVSHTLSVWTLAVLLEKAMDPLWLWDIALLEEVHPWKQAFRLYSIPHFQFLIHFLHVDEDVFFQLSAMAACCHVSLTVIDSSLEP